MPCPKATPCLITIRIIFLRVTILILRFRKMQKYGLLLYRKERGTVMCSVFIPTRETQPPSSIPVNKNITIIFPNVSGVGSGGGLNTGDKVKLGAFSAGTSIGWILLAKRLERKFCYRRKCTVILKS